MDTYRTADEALASIAERIMGMGEEVGTRQGERAMELTGQTFRITEPRRRVILNTKRKAVLAAQIAETAWVLAGRNDVGWLSHYLPRAKDFSDDGIIWRGAYGPRLRCWGPFGHRSENAFTTVGPMGPAMADQGVHVDQLDYVVQLLQEDPMTRRAVITLYDPQVDSKPGKDIPCNNWLHFTNRLGKLDLLVSIRSNDLIWGWSGINQFEWSVLLEVVARLVGVDVGSITYTVGSQHIYEKHWGRATELAHGHALSFSPGPAYYPPPSWQGVGGLDRLLDEWFDVEGMIRNNQPGWSARAAGFPEPMLRSWLYVLGYYWTGDKRLLNEIMGTNLYFGALDGPVRAIETPPREIETPLRDDFYEYVTKLHERKHAAYGDSWKRRGEYVGILANIARKVDRLGVTNEDETEADTAIDLLAYLVKYAGWIAQVDNPADELRDFNERLSVLSKSVALYRDRDTKDNLIGSIRAQFDNLEAAAGATGGARDQTDRAMYLADITTKAYRLALLSYRDMKSAGHDGDDYRGADVD